MTLYYPSNARTDDQRRRMIALEAEQLCIFCQDAYTAEERRILYIHGEWHVENNLYPYPDTRVHLLLVPRHHWTDFSWQNSDAEADFFHCLNWARHQYALRDYIIKIRNGNPAATGGTIEHLHVHVYDRKPGGARAAR